MRSPPPARRRSHQKRTIEIILLRGPLEDEWLRVLAQLYGSHDPKYSSEAFLRYQFNGNPYGFSLHSFARADEETVGHCAVIPVPTRVAGVQRMTGKTESLFVRPDHRGRRDDEDESLAVAMVRRLYAYAGNEGFRDIHSLGRPEFAKIHAAGGARVLEFTRRQYAFFLRSEAVSSLLGPELEGERAQGILDKQQRLLRYVLSEIEQLPLEHREIAPTELGDLDLAAFTQLAPQGERWTVAPTSDSAPWFVGSPAVRRLHASSERERFECVYSGTGSGSWLEIFDWRCGEDSLTLALGVLCRLIEDAEREGRDLVCFFDWSTYNPSAGVLQRAAARLGCESVERPRLIYVRSEDRAFATVDRMTFSPYLYATF